MPNRTIYISDADEAIFEKARQLAGDNLSATIVRALRRFVDMQEQDKDGFQEITVKVGRQVIVQKQFMGRLLAQGRFKSSDERRVEVIQVYQTRKEAIAVYRRNRPDWGPWAFAPNEMEGFPPFGRMPERMEKLREKAFEKVEKTFEKMGNPEDGVEYSLDVYESLEKIKDLVPEELYAAAEAHLRHGPVEILDI